MVKLERGDLEGSENFRLQRVQQGHGQVLNQPGILRRRNGSEQLAVDDGHGEATSPIFPLNGPVPAETKITGVRCAAREMVDVG